MFYGSDDSATAIAEIDDDPELGIAVGTFRSTRDAKILDLTNLPRRWVSSSSNLTRARSTDTLWIFCTAS
jgi:hypothetical protein